MHMQQTVTRRLITRGAVPCHSRYHSSRSTSRCVLKHAVHAHIHLPRRVRDDEPVSSIISKAVACSFSQLVNENASNSAAGTYLMGEGCMLASV